MKKPNETIINYIYISTYTLILFFILFNIKTLIASIRNIVSMFAPFIIGFFIAFIINILVKKFEKYIFPFLDNTNVKNPQKLKRVLSIICSLILIFGLFALIITFVVPQLLASIKTLVDTIPSYIKEFENFIVPIINSTDIASNIWNAILETWKEILSFVGTLATSFINSLLSTTVLATSIIVKGFIGFVFSIYMLLNKETLIFQLKKVLYAFIPKDKVDSIISIGHLTNETFSKFFAGQLAEALILGFLCFLGLTLLKMPYPLLIGTIIGTTNMLPVIGPFIGAIPSLFVIVMVNPPQAIIFIIFILVLQQLENNLIYPKVVGTSIGLSALWVLLAITIGGNLGGAVGMLLSVPSMAVIYKLGGGFINSKLSKNGIVLNETDTFAMKITKITKKNQDN